jgi:hypothetical protein
MLSARARVVLLVQVHQSVALVSFHVFPRHSFPRHLNLRSCAINIDVSSLLYISATTRHTGHPATPIEALSPKPHCHHHKHLKMSDMNTSVSTNNARQPQPWAALVLLSTAAAVSIHKSTLTVSKLSNQGLKVEGYTRTVQ